MNKLFVVSVLAGLTSFAGLANAVTKSATFEVNLTVVKTCSVSASALSFGSADAGTTTDLTGTSTISVKCSKGTPYTVALQSTNKTGDINGAGVLKGQTSGNNDTVAYQLTRGSGNVGATVWGTGTNSWTPSNTAGNTETVTVYGRVTGGSLNVQPDTYKDTVTVSVEY
ncbi:spore coat U domain-containing protein [Variovorax dokdonensis]|uniref:Spore coat U domain-containing protein n=1 Tax=Variovorax dokdonensis TaxID=344883 RepID=A0ABT7NAW2_9BURK|nr:spore coat U domain-containing protein [Variovorax dokdonensis]MDM0045086.1 spore coat U domain-containing protein [Variovorax dokdonensis]